MILIVSNGDDGHVRAVTAELARRGQDYRIFDPADFPAQASATLGYSQTVGRSILEWDGDALCLNDVKSIWYRRPGNFVLSDRLLPDEKTWVRSESGHFFRAIWNATQAFWISRPDAIRAASVKGVQLRIARELGLAIPTSLITNDVAEARAFIERFPSGVIVKALDRPYILSQGRLATVFTHLLSPEDCEQLESVRHGPTFLQQFIPKTLDIRVTVIGSRLFAVGIESNVVAEGRVDFRKAEIYDLPHKVVDLPASVGEACIDLVARLGLAFGAIDLLLTPAGDYVFLEINPNGQWYWLEWVTGIPLTRTMCDLLAAPPQTRD